MRALKQLVIPEGLVVLAALAATGIAPLWAALAPLAGTLLGVALGLGALLSLRFHRGRLLLLFLLLGGAGVVLACAPAWPAEARRAAFALTALLLPLDFALIAVLPERGAFSRPGLARLGVLVTQALAGAALARYAGASVAGLLERPFTAALITDWTPLPQVALALCVVALLLFLVLWVRDPSPVARGLIWGLLAAGIALHVGGGADAGAAARTADLATTWLAAAGLVLALAVIESSYALAYRDGLTGLPSRRSFTEASEGLGERYAVAMVDVDHFKQCNDTWGHHVGDQVLRMVAARLEDVGGGGKAYRYGGEEFAVLFPGLGVDEALPHCEALREKVEGSSFAIRQKGRPRKHGEQKRGTGKRREAITVTVSIGVAEGSAPGKLDDVVRAADRALYRAKEVGRNRVEEN